jgi:hypothetical protein
MVPRVCPSTAAERPVNGGGAASDAGRGEIEE